MHTFISLEIESEQSGRRLGGWNGIIIRSLLCKESVFWCRTQPTMFWSQRHNALDHPVPGRPLYLPRCTHRVSFIGKCSNIPMFSVFRIVSQVMMKIQKYSLLFQPLITKKNQVPLASVWWTLQLVVIVVLRSFPISHFVLLKFRNLAESLDLSFGIKSGQRCMEVGQDKVGISSHGEQVPDGQPTSFIYFFSSF